MRNKPLIAPVLLLTLLSLSRICPAQEPLQPRLQKALNDLVAACNVPGVSAALVMPAGDVIPLVAGFSDCERETPMAAETLLLQGSVGKTYVAALALQLVADGKFSLDDKIASHLGDEPWFKRLPNGQDITVKMLLNHTSGLVRYEFNESFVRDLTNDQAKRWKPAELVSYILDTEAPFAAGVGWEYSDTNYIVLGMLIEKVTGKSYFEELRSRILQPLKLAQTHPVEGPSIAGLAQGYAGARNPFGGQDRMLDEHGQMIINPQFEWTGGGIASTPSDLARWAKLLYEGKVVGPEQLQVMFEGAPAPMLGREATYGLGVIIRPTSLGTSYGHSGFFPGYMCEVMYWPEHEIAVAVQLNTSEAGRIRPPLARWCVRLAEQAVSQPVPAREP